MSKKNTLETILHKGPKKASACGKSPPQQGPAFPHFLISSIQSSGFHFYLVLVVVVVIVIEK